MKALFGPDGVSSVDSTLLEEAQQTVRQLCDEMPTALAYIESRILPLLTENRAANRTSFTNNNAESINHVLKKATGWTRQRLPELIKTVEAVVRAQETEERRALFGVGEYKLATSYQQYAVSRERWKSLSVQQRQRATKRFLTNAQPAGRPSHVTSTDGKLRVRKPTGSKKPNQNRRAKSSRTTSRKK